MGWFQHGSTIVVLAPPGFRLASNLDTGSQVKMGQALMHGVG
jgi:phosphatidylserine decarboxylase